MAVAKGGGARGARGFGVCSAGWRLLGDEWRVRWGLWARSGVGCMGQVGWGVWARLGLGSVGQGLGCR